MTYLDPGTKVNQVARARESNQNLQKMGGRHLWFLCMAMYINTKDPNRNLSIMIRIRTKGPLMGNCLKTCIKMLDLILRPLWSLEINNILLKGSEAIGVIQSR